MDKRTIGGFFPLAHITAEPCAREAVFWPLHGITFHNARSCLAHLFRCNDYDTVWFPAYSCTSLITSPKAAFYPVTEDLSPDTRFLKEHVKAKEAVVVVDYFGRKPSPAFRKFATERPDITWIEDRAHCFPSEKESWAQHVVYSPRKVVGVPDGGILLSFDALPTPTYTPLTSARFLEAAFLRYEDTDETLNSLWYASYVAYEKEMAVGSVPMSLFSRHLLARIDLAPLALKRLQNYRTLHKQLHTHALFKAWDEQDVPSGFPIRVPDAAAFAKALHSKRIFAARHWAELPSAFPFETALSQELVTLPCDHRYDETAMAFIAACVKEQL